MNTPAKPPGSLWELVLGGIQTHLGTKGVFIVLLLATAGTAAWNWESISSNSLFESVRAEYFAEPIPIVERGAISILVANLRGDVGHKFKERLTSELIPDQLPVDRSPIRIYKLDRYIRGTSSEAIEFIREAGAHARELLNQTKADLLVWGSLEGADKSPTPVIFVTASGNRYSKVAVGTEIKIPGGEKGDMLKLLRIVALTEWAQLEKEDGTAFEPGIVEQLKTTFDALQLYSNASSVAKHEVNTIVARAKARIGRAYDNQQLLKEARDSLQIVATAPGLDVSIKADVELGLGLANFGLADLKPEKFTHGEALLHYQAALVLAESIGDIKRQEQALIGIAGSHLASYQSNLMEPEIRLAMEHSQKALVMIDKEQDAADWCRATQSLAVAHRLLGEIRRDPALLQKSIAGLQDVLLIRNKEIVPVFWANTKNSLGNVWATKSALTGDYQDYVATMNHYQGALEVFDAKRFPLMYGTVTMNLALAEEDLWQHKRDETLRQRALAHYQTAKSVFQQLGHTDRMNKAASGIARLDPPPPTLASAEPEAAVKLTVMPTAPADKVEIDSKIEPPPQEKIEAAMRRDKLIIEKFESKSARSPIDKTEMSHKSWSDHKSMRHLEKVEASKK